MDLITSAEYNVNVITIVENNMRSSIWHRSTLFGLHDHFPAGRVEP